MKYLVQDGGKIKKATMKGLEEVKEGIPNSDDFEEHGTDYLSNIIGSFVKEVDMVYDGDLGEGKLYSYKLIGFKDINNLGVR